METIKLTGSAVTGIETHLPGLPNLPTSVKLGRIRPKVLPYVPKFSTYFDPSKMTTTLPTSTNYRANAAAAIARMYLNDTYGDCVIASKYHAVGVWTGNKTGTPVQGTDAEVLNMYHTICGPGDNGCNITTVLGYMVSHGLPLGGVQHRIDGYVACDWTNKLETQVVTFLDGSSSIGINLPQAWTQNAIWDVTNTPIVGGHDVNVIDFSEQGVYVASWGRIYMITWAAWMSRTWLEEYYFQLSPDWYGSDKLAPCGVDATTLKADMDQLGQGVIPNIGPGPTPPPPLPVPTPTRLFGLHFGHAIPKGGLVRFNAPVLIPAGNYDVVEATKLGEPVEQIGSSVGICEMISGAISTFTNGVLSWFN